MYLKMPIFAHFLENLKYLLVLPNVQYVSLNLFVMMKMVNFKKLGYNSLDEYNECYYDNLMLTNKTYTYFVNWENSKLILNKYKEEIEILNSLSNFKGNVELKLKELIMTNSRIVELLPLLLSEKIKTYPSFVLDTETESFREFDFRSENISTKNVDAIISFANKTGLLDLVTQEIDLYSYLLGVYVGNDTNTRKNRSGKIFEVLVGRKLNRILDPEYEIVEQDPNFSLSKSKAKRRVNRHDFVIYYEGKPVMVIESNFYNDTGSKPSTISREYVLNNEEAKTQNVLFVWVTDGQGWKKMRRTLDFAMERIDFILNFNMLERLLLVIS